MPEADPNPGFWPLNLGLAGKGVGRGAFWGFVQGCLLESPLLPPSPPSPCPFSFPAQLLLTGVSHPPFGGSREPANPPESRLRFSPRAASSPRPGLIPGLHLGLGLLLILGAAAAVAHQGSRAHGACGDHRAAGSRTHSAPGIPDAGSAPGGGAKGAGPALAPPLGVAWMGGASTAQHPPPSAPSPHCLALAAGAGQPDTPWVPPVSASSFRGSCGSSVCSRRDQASRLPAAPKSAGRAQTRRRSCPRRPGGIRGPRAPSSGRLLP